MKHVPYLQLKGHCLTRLYSLIFHWRIMFRLLNIIGNCSFSVLSRCLINNGSYILYREDKNFLQVQSEHSKRLRNAISSFEKCFRDMVQASPNKKVLNKNQCIHLLGKFILAMKEIDKMLSSATRISSSNLYLRNCVSFKRK